jgi:hypothetical protein
MTAREKEKVYKSFKRVIENRDITLIDKRLYKHLHQNCGFIAHYDIHGFRAAYSGRGFLEFIDYFLNPPFFGLGPKEYHDINNAMRALVEEHAELIFEEFENREMNKEIELLKRLAAKHGYLLVPKDQEVIHPDLKIDEDGQLCLF